MCDSNLNFFNLRFTDKTNFSNRHYASCILIRHINYTFKKERGVVKRKTDFAIESRRVKLC